MAIQTDAREIPQFGFSEERQKYKKVLYLGNHITPKSLDAGFYYFNVGNWFWELIKRVYSSAEITASIDEYNMRLSKAKRRAPKGRNYRRFIVTEMTEVRNKLIRCLQKHGIVINDLIGLCICEGARDDQIIEATPNDGTNGFHDVPALMRDADLIVVNGKGLTKSGRVKEHSARYYMNLFGFGALVDPSKIKYVYGSTPGIPGLAEKEKDWKNLIGNVKTK